MPTLTLTPQVADAIANAVANGVPLETAAVAAGASKAAIYDWIAAGETGRWQQGTPVAPASISLLRNFSDQIARARAQWEVKRLDRIHAAAESAEQKDAWRANAWLLEHHPASKERYAEHRQTTIRHAPALHPAHTVVRELPAEELRMLASGSDDVDESEPGLDR